MYLFRTFIEVVFEGETYKREVCLRDAKDSHICGKVGVAWFNWDVEKFSIPVVWVRGREVRSMVWRRLAAVLIVEAVKRYNASAKEA